MSTLTESSRIVLIFILTNLIAPNRSDNDVAINDVDIKTLVQEDHRLYNDDINYTSELDTLNTTEGYNITDMPEGLGARTKEIDEEYDEIKVGNETVDVTESNDHTVSNQDNSVDKADDDVYNISNTNYYDGKIETTSVLPTTRQAEDEDTISDKTSELQEDQESTEQRSPKVEISDQSDIDTDQRFYEPPNLPPTSKSSTLRGWLEDSWLRPPAAVLVPLRPMALNRALAVWKDVTVENLNVSDIVIVGYDSNGINWRSRHSIQPLNSNPKDVTEALSKLLLKYQGVHIDEASDGTMRALASAAKLVPYDSALFVVTDKGAGDPQRLPLALRTLVEKRLKVYTIWTDPNHPSSESENALQELRNISQHTEGDVLHYSLQVIDTEGASNLASDVDLQPWKPIELKQGRKGRVNSEVEIERFDTLLVRRGGGEAISLGLPVENGVTALRILIEGSVEHAVLYPPNDAPQIDLYNMTSVATFSSASRTESLSPRDVYLIFPGAEPIEDMLTVLSAHPDQDYSPGLAGVWHFSVRCDTCDYRLCVTGRGYIHFDVETSGSDTLKLRVTGPVASIRESLLIDEYGTELSKLPFSYQPMTSNGPAESIELSDELEAEVNLPSIRGSKVYVKIVGRDLKGEPFVRLAGPLNKAEVRVGRSATITFPDSINDLERVEDENSRAYSRLRYSNGNDSTLRTSSQVVSQQGTLLTEVQIGLSTRLYGSPGDELQLYFEVTNYRDQSVRFSFGAVGELRFLTGISPTSQVLSPGQTTNVIVRVSISSTAQPGARDFITFTAYGLEQVSISAYVYVVSSGVTVTDVWAPELSHNFQGTCIGKMGSDCAQYSWSATIIARDATGGLLRLSSSPSGLVYDSNFISGTRDEVTAIYRATCCAPRMLVNAVDTFGNTNSYIVDISYYITGAGIAAIVLGVILAIALIAVVISLIYCCVKKRRESRELPYSTSSRNIS